MPADYAIIIPAWNEEELLPATLASVQAAMATVGGFDERFYASKELHLSAALRTWGLRNSYAMSILNEPITTSARKVRWFGPRDMLRLTWRLFLRPCRMTDRNACDLWYKRPDDC